MDNAFQQGDIQQAFDIYNTFRCRALQPAEYEERLLQRGILDQSVALGRDEAPWPAEKASFFDGGAHATENLGLLLDEQFLAGDGILRMQHCQRTEDEQQDGERIEQLEEQRVIRVKWRNHARQRERSSPANTMEDNRSRWPASRGQATVPRPRVTTTARNSVVFPTEAYTRCGPKRTKSTPANVIPVHTHDSPHPVEPTIHTLGAGAT